MFANPRCFRDLKEDLEQVNRDARPRDVQNNPLFQDGDLIYDGVVVREIPEFETAKFSSSVNAETTLESVGASSIDVGANFLCGCQAIGMVNKQLATPTTKNEDDYGFVKGIGIELAHGIEKMTWNNGSNNRQDVGIVTGYFSATPDA